MAEKVKFAFDVYIFLMYCKKNSKYTNELMRLIHKNKFCRDIDLGISTKLFPARIS